MYPVYLNHQIVGPNNHTLTQALTITHWCRPWQSHTDAELVFYMTSWRYNPHSFSVNLTVSTFCTNGLQRRRYSGDASLLKKTLQNYCQYLMGRPKPGEFHIKRLTSKWKFKCIVALQVLRRELGKLFLKAGDVRFQLSLMRENKL